MRGADVVELAEGSIAYTVKPGLGGPPGSKRGTIMQGLPRNLGELVFSTEGKAARALRLNWEKFNLSLAKSYSGSDQRIARYQYGQVFRSASVFSNP
jgi:hypothetical protein